MAYTGKAPFSIQSGGTGLGTLTSNSVLVGNGVSPITEVTPVANGVLISSNADVPSWLANSSTPGWVLTANSGAPPSWQSPASAFLTVNIVVFTNSGTYSKPGNLSYAVVEVSAGGGGGGGNAINSSVSVSIGGGGGCGGYTKGVFAASSLLANETVTIGALGAGGPGINGGGTGGVTTFGAHLSVNGGLGGAASAQITTYTVAPGGVGGSINTAGSYSIQGQEGGYGAGFCAVSGDAFFLSGAGGSGPLGFGGAPLGNNTTGATAVGYGAGGSGGAGIESGGGTGGGDGAAGICIITEFLT